MAMVKFLVSWLALIVVVAAAYMAGVETTLDFVETALLLAVVALVLHLFHHARTQPGMTVGQWFRSISDHEVWDHATGLAKALVPPHEKVTIKEIRLYVLLAMASLIVAATLFPPWVRSTPNRNVDIQIGYGFLWSRAGYAVHVDYGRVFIEIALIAALGGAALVLTYLYKTVSRPS